MRRERPTSREVICLRTEVTGMRVSLPLRASFSRSYSTNYGSNIIRHSNNTDRNVVTVNVRASLESCYGQQTRIARSLALDRCTAVIYINDSSRRDGSAPALVTRLEVHRSSCFSLSLSLSPLPRSFSRQRGDRDLII